MQEQCPTVLLSIMATFQQLKQKVDRLISPAAQAEGLTPLQVFVLLQARNGPVPVGTISAQARIGPANASTLCKKLEQGGYLIRTRDTQDERVVTVSVTERGQQSLSRIQARLMEYIRLAESLSPQVQDDMRRGIRTLDLILDYLYEQTKGEQNPC